MQTYDSDIVAWSREQAALLRAGRLENLDLEHIAPEIEDLAKSEQREFASRTALLLGHLLKWQYQPEHRGPSWDRTIRAQRKELAYNLEETPSLRVELADARWLDMVWARAVALAVTETGRDCFPEDCAWSLTAEVLNPTWLPE